MKTILSIFLSFFLWMNIPAQQASQRVVATSNGKAISIQPIKKVVADNSLPLNLYKTLRDSCNMIDLVYSVGGSMSLNGRNVQLFSSFVEQKGTKKDEALPKEGFIMWQINGREFITGDMYFSSDTTGYLVFKKDDKEYINTLNKQGAGFLKKQKK